MCEPSWRSSRRVIGGRPRAGSHLGPRSANASEPASTLPTTGVPRLWKFRRTSRSCSAAERAQACFQAPAASTWAANRIFALEAIRSMRSNAEQTSVTSRSNTAGVTLIRYPNRPRYGSRGDRAGGRARARGRRGRARRRRRPVSAGHRGGGAAQPQLPHRLHRHVRVEHRHVDAERHPRRVRVRAHGQRLLCRPVLFRAARAAALPVDDRRSARRPRRPAPVAREHAGAARRAVVRAWRSSRGSRTLRGRSSS